MSCTEAGRPRQADEGGLGERGVSWTEEGRPKSERRTEEGLRGLSRMLASEAAGWGGLGVRECEQRQGGLALGAVSKLDA